MSGRPPLAYAEAVEALTRRGRFGISLGLQRVERLMAEVGHPERGLRGALVGGTNGKGSVVAMVRAVLRAAGYRVGTMPKPHLVSYRERVAIDGEPISPDAFAAAVARVLPAIDRVADEIGPPTEFEALTAAAILELARREVDLAVVEVGMGGRLDATNVLDLGVAAITNVQLDHEAYLGHTLTAIGGEKAPIIKAGNLAVTGASGRGLRPILDRAAELGVPLRRAGPRQPYEARLVASDWDGIVVDARTPAGPVGDLRIGLLGAHQAQNAAVAMALLDALRERWGIGIAEGALRDGMAAARWPGRMELLDGAGLGPRARPARRRPQPGGRRGARAFAVRPRAPPSDDRVRRDARERRPRRPVRARAARASLRVHGGGRSQRPCAGRSGAAYGLRSAAGHGPRPRRPRRWPAFAPIRSSWPAPSTWSARSGA